ncbi:MFS general substrate transporter [Mrakia frigida]|uniref:MFS general substrate transporter n=1 Tax=Mrakia frigida TaxID=29902 RepID=UPI003FCC054D
MSIHKTEGDAETAVVEVEQPPVRTGWRGKYDSALVQMVLVSFVCFCCPGMFNALSGLGGGGKQDATTADNGSVALYSTFAVFGFFGGTICNKLGPRLTLSIGSLGYSLYIGSLYSTVITQTKPRENFVIAAGAILGLCAGMLWTAEGSLMLGYATEKTKGRFTALFWMIFNLGAVIGAAIPLATNWNTGETAAASGSTYIAFLVITLVGACIPFLLTKPSNVVRSDGTRVTVERQSTWKSEFKGLFFVLKSDPWVIFLFPAFMSSNWFYSYQFNSMNGSGYFGIRGRTLNNFLYWLAQIFGSFAIGMFLDSNLTRRTRAYGGWFIAFALTSIIFGGNYAAQTSYTRASVLAEGWAPVTVGDSAYAGRAILYMLNGFYDAVFQTFCYWSIGCLSNDIRKLAMIVGFYKGLQSAGAAITFRLDSLKIPYMTILASSWGVLVAGLLIMAPVLYLRVQNHTVEDVVDAAGDVVPERETKDGEHYAADQKV